MGEATLGSAFGGTVEQFVEVLAAQQEHVFHEGGGLLFGFGHCRSPERRNPPDARGTKAGSGVIRKMGFRFR